MLMKNWFKYVMLTVVAICSLQAIAGDYGLRDTVYLYNTWEQMFEKTPVSMLVDPYIDAVTPYEIYLTPKNGTALNRKHLAATLGDSIWLINTDYFKGSFKGDVENLRGFVPVFFNEKVAYFMYVGYGENLGVKDLLFGNLDNVDYSEKCDFYYIDFFNRKVLKVNSDVLSGLLNDYHDLQMRYEGMKDYKKKSVIQDYFYRFIDSATDDIMRPYILDLVE